MRRKEETRESGETEGRKKHERAVRRKEEKQESGDTNESKAIGGIEVETREWQKEQRRGRVAKGTEKRESCSNATMTAGIQQNAS